MITLARIQVAGDGAMVGTVILHTLQQLGQVAQAVGYTGSTDFDPGKPDGTARKLMDSSRLNALGWQATISLAPGLSLAYQDFLQHL